MDSEKRATQFDFTKVPKRSNPSRVAALPSKSIRRAEHEEVKKAVASSDKKLLPLTLVEAGRAEVRARNHLQQRKENPWNKYEQLYSLQLGDHESCIFTVAMRKESPCAIVNVRGLSRHDSDDQIRIVEGSAISVRKGIAQFAALIDRSGRFRRDVTGDAAWKRELLEQFLHPFGIG